MNSEDLKVVTEQVVNDYRRRYLEARRQLARAEGMFEAEHGRKHPGSPLLVGNNQSLADIVRIFIQDAGQPLTYKQIKGKFMVNEVEFDEGKLKKALRQAIKGPALRRVNSDDLGKEIEDEDLFDAS